MDFKSILAGVKKRQAEAAGIVAEEAPAEPEVKAEEPVAEVSEPVAEVSEPQVEETIERKKFDVAEAKKKAMDMLQSDTVEEPEDTQEPEAENNEAVQAEAEPVAEETPVEETPTEEEPKAEAEAEVPAEEITKEEAPVEEAEPVEEVKAEKPKTRRRKASSVASRAKKAAAEKTAPETTEVPAPAKVKAQSVDIIEIAGTKMSYDDAVALVTNEFEDDKWRTYKQEIIDELRELRIAPDLNQGTIKFLISGIDNLQSKIAVEHAELKALAQVLNNKDDGLCYVVRKANSGEGANGDERRASGYQALLDSKFGDAQINLFNLTASTQLKFIFLDSVMKRLYFLKDSCITLMGAIKEENSLDRMAS